MSILARRRAADRLRWESQIRARPAPARFRNRGAPVLLLAEPGKALSLRAGGFDPGYSAEIVIVLPLTDTKPVTSSEIIDVQGLDGTTQTYNITTPTALEGTGCYRCGITVRRGTPRSASP